ncbi:MULTISPECIES: hypothetical protein [unclassified Sphingomonas]|uniref:hypothetical protein n=1 Tax=unclassified Sphingomonas TaxID=196159 RepID=UPI00226A7A18|nr:MULTISPECIES: hypothetical protein [unclassified Sphingomonas]
MRDLLLRLSQALNDLAASVGTPASTPKSAPTSKRAGGRPKGSIGKRWRDCLRAVCGPDGAGTFGISDISRAFGKPITEAKIRRGLGTLIRAGHVVPRAGSSFQLTEQGLAMLHATKPADDKRVK